MPWVLRAAVAAGGWGCRCGRLGGWAGRVEEQVCLGAETPEAVQSALQSVRERFSELGKERRCWRSFVRLVLRGSSKF